MSPQRPQSTVYSAQTSPPFSNTLPRRRTGCVGMKTVQYWLVSPLTSILTGSKNAFPLKSIISVLAIRFLLEWMVCFLTPLISLYSMDSVSKYGRRPRMFSSTTRSISSHWVPFYLLPDTRLSCWVLGRRCFWEHRIALCSTTGCGGTISNISCGTQTHCTDCKHQHSNSRWKLECELAASVWGTCV